MVEIEELKIKREVKKSQSCSGPALRAARTLKKKSLSNPVLTLSMQKIATQALTLSFNSSGLAKFTLGGRAGNIVISSLDSRVHKGWRVVAIDGARAMTMKDGFADVMKSKHRGILGGGKEYQVTFFVGSEEEEVLWREEKEKEERELREKEAERKAKEIEEERERAKEKKLQREAAAAAAARAAGQEARAAEEKARLEEEARLAQLAKEEEKRRQNDERDRLIRERLEMAEKAVIAKAKAIAEEQRRKSIAEAEEARRIKAAATERVRQRREAERRQREAEEKEAVAKAEEQKTIIVRKRREIEKETGLPPRETVKEPQRALLTMLTKTSVTNSKRIIVDKGPCDKCDGPHGTDSCPHYKKKRDSHSDAWLKYGKNGESSPDDHGQTPSISQSEATIANPRIVSQPGDGSCLFHSLSFSLPSTNHFELRRSIAAYIEKNPHVEIGGTPIKDWVCWDSGCDVKAYANSMATGNKWGGAIEIAVCAKVQKATVLVYERGSGRGVKCISKFDSGTATNRKLLLLYGGRCHYDAIK